MHIMQVVFQNKGGQASAHHFNVSPFPVSPLYFFCYFLICPFPKIIYLVVVSAFSPIGPLA